MKPYAAIDEGLAKYAMLPCWLRVAAQKAAEQILHSCRGLGRLRCHFRPEFLEYPPAFSSYPTPFRPFGRWDGC